MNYIMGIDQGSSKTYAIIGDESGNVLGLGKSYGACHSGTGMQYAMEAVRQAAGSALAQSGLKAAQLSAVAAGMTGMDWDYEKELLKNELLGMFRVNSTIVVNDSIIALRAGTKKGYGAVLCAGSGMNCAINGPDGRQFIYGFYIDEEFQGGSALGRACVRTVIEAELGLGEQTLLRDMILEYLGLNTADELLYHKVNEKITLQHYLGMPLLLEKAAGLGDQAAKEIFTRFGLQYGRYVTRGLKRMGMLELPVDVVLSGSVFKCREPELKAGVRRVLEQEAPLAGLVDAEYEPIVGAYLLGAEQLAPAGEEFYASLKSCCAKYGLNRMKEVSNGRID